jgi:hypothetical protein
LHDRSGNNVFEYSVSYEGATQGLIGRNGEKSKTGEPRTVSVISRNNTIHEVDSCGDEVKISDQEFSERGCLIGAAITILS